MVLPSSDFSRLQFYSIVSRPLGNALGCGIQFLNAAHKKGTNPPKGLECVLSLGKLLCKGLHLRPTMKSFLFMEGKWISKHLWHNCNIDPSYRSNIPDPFKGKHTRVYSIAFILPPFPNQSVFFQSMNNCKIKIRQ